MSFLTNKSDILQPNTAKTGSPFLKKENRNVKCSFGLTPMALREPGKCFKLDVSREVVLYSIYTYENVSRGTVMFKML